MHQILLIEDDLETAEFLTEQFVQIGLKVFHSDRMDKALDLFKNNEIDIVLTDFHIQQGSGRKLLHEIRKVNPTVPVLLMTGTPFVDESSFLIYQFDKIFLKPFSTQSLISEIKKRLSID